MGKNKMNTKNLVLIKKIKDFFSAKTKNHLIKNFDVIPLEIQEKNIKLEKEGLTDVRNFIEEIKKDEKTYTTQCQDEPYLLAEKGCEKLYLGYYRNSFHDEKLKFGIYKGYTNNGINKKLDANNPKRYFKISSCGDQLNGSNYENKELCKYFKIQSLNELKNLVTKSVSKKYEEDLQEDIAKE